MAIKSLEYKQLIEAAQKVFKSEQVLFDNDTISIFDEIRKLITKFNSELNYLAVYPFHDLGRAKGLATDIAEHCKVVNVKYNFYTPQAQPERFKGEASHKVDAIRSEKENYVLFSYNGINITSLINIKTK